MPQTELHRHLDVSLRPATALQLAQERGLIAQSTSLEQFCDQLILRKPLKDLGTVLATFSLFQKILDRPEVLAQVAYEVIEDCWNEGTRKVELRFSPGFITEFNGMSWDDVLLGFEQGLKKALKQYPEMKAGFLCIGSRDLGPESVDKTVEFFLKNQARFLGLDLAGDEALYSPESFESSFKKAIQKSARITIHAGEASGPENVWKAIEILGAQRIGHGIRSTQDPLLVEYLAKNQICLEICPTSNWLTQAAPSIEANPLPQLLRQGVPVCINTDDPAVFGVTLPHELQVCREKMGLSPQEIQKTLDFASAHSFL